MSKLQEIRDIKIQGTKWDRRSKNKCREMIVHLYEHRKEYNIKAKDIAKMFELNTSQVYRYAHYDRYLELCNKTSKAYNKKIGKKEISRRNKIQYKKIVEYKTKLYNEEYVGIDIEFAKKYI